MFKLWDANVQISFAAPPQKKNPIKVSKHGGQIQVSSCLVDIHEKLT